MKINFKIITPERTVLTEEVDSLTCPTIDGQITVLPNHIPLISPIQHGELVTKINGTPHYYAVVGGFVEVRPSNEVVVLADSAEHFTEINEAEAEEARARAEESMKNKDTLSSAEYSALASSLQRSLVRLKVARRNPHRGHHGVGSEGVFKE
jgi:F-type H+-transporting ATPase subunit epsilon